MRWGGGQWHRWHAAHCQMLLVTMHSCICMVIIPTFTSWSVWNPRCEDAHTPSKASWTIHFCRVGAIVQHQCSADLVPPKRNVCFHVILQTRHRLLKGGWDEPGHEGACPAPFTDQNCFCNKRNVQLLKPYAVFCFADQKSLLPWELQNESIMAQPGRNRNLCWATTAPGLLGTNTHVCSAWKQKAPSNLTCKPPPANI